MGERQAMMIYARSLLTPVILFLLASIAIASARAAPVIIASGNLEHAISLYGAPAYPADFQHFRYVNPRAPKGGELRQAALGQFDSLTPYIDRGVPAAGAHLQYDSLLARSWDEPLSKYGLIAEYIERDPDNHWVAFHVNPKARFNDGIPVTAEDVKFSFDLLREKGSHFYHNFYREVKSVDVTGRFRVLFTFTHNQNRELASNLGQMPVLPKHFWKDRDFSSPGLLVPVSSGPYKVLEIDPGRSITYQRNPDYWGKDLAVNRGRHNFDRITYLYFRDANVAQQALLKGEFDFSIVVEPRVWQNLMREDMRKSLQAADLITKTLPNGNPQTLMLTYNTRHTFLQDKRVRQAIGSALHFQWLNKNLFYGMTRRANSYYAGTELASRGLPSQRELKWLEPWRKQLPVALFKQPFSAPGFDPEQSDRIQKGDALQLLKDAGWHIKNNRQVNARGEKLFVSLLVYDPDHERSALSLKKQLENIGIELNIRTVDVAQYVQRVRSLDFDMILNIFPHTPSPGTEQANLFGSDGVNEHGSRNLAGINNPVVDDLVSKIPTAQSREELLSLVHALDRVMLWQHYSLPLWYMSDWPLVYRKHLHHPAKPAPYALDMSTWWSDEKQATGQK